MRRCHSTGFAPDVLFEAVTALVPREDRVSERPVFQDFGGERSARRSRAPVLRPVFPLLARTT
jgi:hypothetical protein